MGWTESLGDREADEIIMLRLKTGVGAVFTEEKGHISDAKGQDMRGNSSFQERKIIQWTITWPDS